VLLSIFNVRSSDVKNQPVDIVSFFKKTINAPPDIEHIVFKEQMSGRPAMAPSQLASLAAHGIDLNKLSPPQFFEGARAGNNFFLSAIVNSNDVPKAMVPGPVQIDVISRQVTGRAGTNSYQVGMRELRTTTEGDSETRYNKPARESQSFYEFFNQIVHMGIGGLKEQTAVWVGNEFAVERDGYSPIHGELIISNNLPSVLKISETNAAVPFEIFRYVYPDPPDSLGGFPEKITRFMLVNGEERPAVEYNTLQIQVAKNPLAEDFFAAARFVTTNITFTNSYSKGVSYTMSDGKVRKNLPPQVILTNAYSSRNARIAIIITFAIVTLVFVFFIFRSSHTRK
jgi:hypothetical protein